MKISLVRERGRRFGEQPVARNEGTRADDANRFDPISAR
jgi:hypothetical protein